MNAGLDCKRPGCRGQPGKVVVYGLAAGKRIAGMKIEGLAERGGRRPEIREPFVIVVDSVLSRAHLGEAIYHEAVKSELLYAPFQLALRSLGILHGQRC